MTTQLYVEQSDVPSTSWCQPELVVAELCGSAMLAHQHGTVQTIQICRI